MGEESFGAFGFWGCDRGCGGGRGDWEDGRASSSDLNSPQLGSSHILMSTKKYKAH